MIKDINGLGGVTNTQSRSNNSAGKAATATDADNNSATRAPAQQDGVEISNRAQTLQTLEAKLQDLPEVNTARVEAIRNALEQGQFKIDDLVIADKLINTDTLLGE